MCPPDVRRPLRPPPRRRSAQRGIAAGQVELLITIATIALAVSTALVKVAGPRLVKMFRHDQIAAASPMP